MALKEDQDRRQVKCLDQGYVRLVDWMPRHLPEGWTLEYGIVQAARGTLGRAPTNPASDQRLISYLWDHNHTSPFEFVEFTFEFRAPIFVARQLLRHRTANVNELSQRYTSVEDQNFYHPSHQGVRLKPTRATRPTTKQGSTALGVEDRHRALVVKAEQLCDQIFQHYETMIAEGIAPEMARFCLPLATYTQFYFKLDLNNLAKLLVLRLDETAQLETRIYAQAMLELIEPLVPQVTKLIQARQNGLYLDHDEVLAIAEGAVVDTNSKSKLSAFKAKRNRLGL